MANPRVRKPVTGGVAGVPMIIQLETLECGAACLTMILAYYNKFIPLEQVRKDCGVSRDGSNAANMLKAARSYGLTAKGYRYEPEALKSEGKFPCIIHWNFNHFVVLCGFKGGKAIINDPAKGNYSVTMEAFDKAFTGVCLMFEPSDAFEPGGKPKSIWRFAKKKLSGTGGIFALILVTTVITSLIGIITPGFANVFADRLITGASPDWFYPFIYAFGALVVVQIIVTWIQQVYMLKGDGKIAIVSNARFMWHVLRMPMEFFSQRMAGDVLSRKDRNAEIANVLVQTFAPLMIQAAMMIFYLMVMINYSTILAGLGLLSIALNLLVARYISGKRVDVMRVVSRDEGRLSGMTVSGIEMIETIKASGAENGFFEKWSGYQAGANAGKVKYTKINIYLGLIPVIITAITNTVIFMASVWLCMSGEWTVGMIAAFSGLLMAFTAPAGQLIEAMQTFQEMRTDMERIEDVLEYPADVHFAEENAGVDGAGAKTVEEGGEPVGGYGKLKGKIEMRNVTFGYSPLAEPVIKDFNMVVEPGKRVAFVGPSGCGKSTLSKLISGLYKPWSGEILFDDKPIDEIDRNVRAASLAVVDQDIILFEDTIANNIRLWDTSIEDFEVIMAARDAHIHEDIMERDGGYQHRLTEGGRNFSGGQRQRLEIARALAQETTMIIMDEATSALDAKTEHKIVSSIADRGITCVVIAHRLSTIRDCDEIIVLDKGQVVERGTHEGLCAKGGIYTKLVSSE